MDTIKFSSEFDKKKMARIFLPIVAIAIALLIVVSISTVAAPPSPVNAKVVTSDKILEAVGDETSFFVFVQNNKQIPIDFGARDTITGAFVVTSITLTTVFPNGTETEPWVITPGGEPYRWASRWPQTVYNTTDHTLYTLGSPAVLPGENVAIFNFGMGRGADEPIGKYTTIIDITGTIDNMPVTISAQIQITYK